MGIFKSADGSYIYVLCAIFITTTNAKGFSNTYCMDFHRKLF